MGGHGQQGKITGGERLREATGNDGGQREAIGGQGGDATEGHGKTAEATGDPMGAN